MRSEISRESGQKRTNKKIVRKNDIVAINKKQKAQAKPQTEETNWRQPYKTLFSRLRKRDSPISGGIQPRHKGKGKGDGCDTYRKKNTDKGKGDNNQIKKIMRYTDTRSIAMG